uniref:Uncharacterized protein n=1 Tax=Timema shepardi TaxID=629360 RepID=A0A7R9B0A1_TIMSH|nr:unnamed protein product [Timema shepardi]
MDQLSGCFSVAPSTFINGVWDYSHHSVGIVLITVSGVAWRLTAHDAPTCRMMLGLGGGEDGSAEPNRRFVPRLPPSYGRPHHPYAAMMYPEFQYRPPPPSYQASMQEYRLRLLLLDRHSGTGGPTHTVSPPPTYRSHAGSTLRHSFLPKQLEDVNGVTSLPGSNESGRTLPPTLNEKKNLERHLEGPRIITKLK